jgi:hypothetical protein
MAETLTLHFPDVVRVAGETLQGTVDINIPMATEDKVENVRVKVRGSIVTYVLLFVVRSSLNIAVGN